MKPETTVQVPGPIGNKVLDTPTESQKQLIGHFWKGKPRKIHNFLNITVIVKCFNNITRHKNLYLLGSTTSTTTLSFCCSWWWIIEYKYSKMASTFTLLDKMQLFQGIAWKVNKIVKIYSIILDALVEYLLSFLENVWTKFKSLTIHFIQKMKY